MTAPLRSRKSKSDFLPLLWNFNALYFLQHLDPALNLARLGIFGPESFDKPFGLLDLSLLGFIGRLENSLPGLFLLQIVIIVPMIDIDPLSFDLCDSIDKVVEKDPVVGNDDHGTRIIN